MDNGPYNPYANRQIEVPLTNFDAFFSLVKCVVGTGILAMPKAFFYTGILAGIMLTVLSTIILIYGMHLLIKCMVESARQQETPYCTYSESMAYAFTVGPHCCTCCSRAAGLMVNLVLALSHYGIAVVYILFVAKNFHQLVGYYFVTYQLEFFVCGVGLLLLPLFMIRQLKYLVPLNVVSNFLMYFGFVLIFYYLFHGLPSIEDRMFGEYEELLEFFGIVLFGVTSVGVMLAIESKMAKPEKYLGWLGVLNIAVIIVIVSNLLFGVLGFWRYGEAIRSSVTLNLPPGEIASQLSKFTIALAIFLTYPLSGYVTIDIIIHQSILKGRHCEHPHLIEYVARVIFVILSTINAMAFPTLSPLVGLVGSVTISVLNLIFPALIEMCLLYSSSYGRYKWILIKDILLALLGLMIFIYGIYSGTLNILNVFHPGFQQNARNFIPDDGYQEEF